MEAIKFELLPGGLSFSVLDPRDVGTEEVSQLTINSRYHENLDSLIKSVNAHLGVLLVNLNKEKMNRLSSTMSFGIEYTSRLDVSFSFEKFAIDRYFIKFSKAGKYRLFETSSEQEMINLLLSLMGQLDFMSDLITNEEWEEIVIETEPEEDDELEYDPNCPIMTNFLVEPSEAFVEDNDIVLKVSHVGFPSLLKVHHNYDRWFDVESPLLWFSLYPFNNNVWGGTETASLAIDVGLNAVYEKARKTGVGTWTLRIEAGGTAYEYIRTKVNEVGREFVFRPRMLNEDGESVGQLYLPTGFEGGDEIVEPVPEPIVPAEIVNVTSSVNGEVVVEVEHVGDAKSLKIVHSYDKNHNTGPSILPTFTVYADSDVWGDPQSTLDAQTYGISVEYLEMPEGGKWTIRILEDDPLFLQIQGDGRPLSFYFRLIDIEENEADTASIDTGWPSVVEPSPSEPIPPTLDLTNTLVSIDDDLVLTISYEGDSSGVVINHSYDEDHVTDIDNLLPSLKLYPDSTDPWNGMPGILNAGRIVASATFVETQDGGIWTLTLHQGGLGLNTINSVGDELVFYLDLLDTESESAQTTTIQTDFPVNTAIEFVDSKTSSYLLEDNLVIEVTHVGSPESLRVRHSYDKNHSSDTATQLPWFTLYPDVNQPWDTVDGSDVQAAQAGITATYETDGTEGVWKLTILKDGMVDTVIKTKGDEFVLYPELRNDREVVVQTTINTSYPPVIVPMDYVLSESGTFLDVQENIVLEVTHTGTPYSLRVRHSYDKNYNSDVTTQLPWYTLYPDELDPWGDETSILQAQQSGVEATYEVIGDKGKWIFTILKDGSVYDHISQVGIPMVFYPRLLAEEGSSGLVQTFEIE